MPLPLCEDWFLRSRDLSRSLARTGLGDREAFAALYRQTSPHLYAVVLRLCRDRAQAQDVLQDVYVSVWHAASRFDEAQSEPWTWLTGMARKLAIDSLARDLPPQPAGALSGMTHPDAEQMFSSAAEDPPCGATLTSPQRLGFALAVYDGLGHAQLAAATGEPPRTVRQWLRTALMTLRASAHHTARRHTTTVLTEP